MTIHEGDRVRHLATDTDHTVVRVEEWGDDGTVYVIRDEHGDTHKVRARDVEATW